MGKYKDISNQVFTRLTAIKPVGKEIHGSMLWLCSCSCGRNKITSYARLKNGDTKSCGCLIEEYRRMPPPISEETRLKLSIARKKRKIIPSNNTKKKISETLKKYFLTHYNPRKGKTHTLEAKEKNRQAHLGIKMSEESKKKKSIALKGRKKTEEHKKKIGEGNKGKIISEASKLKMSIAKKGKTAWNKGLPITGEWKRKLCIARIGLNLGVKRSKEMREKLSKTKKKQWQDSAFAKKMGGCWGIKPNKPELLLNELLNRLYPNEWKYTGDFSFIINGKNPDFININGQKKCIELYGDYWHKGQDPQDRINIFKEYGWDTLVIWEKELKNMGNVMNRLKEFVSK